MVYKGEYIWFIRGIYGLLREYMVYKGNIWFIRGIYSL